ELAPGRLAWLQRDLGPDRLLRLHARLLVDRDDDRALGRIEVEAAHLRLLRLELGIDAPEPAAHLVRLQVGLAQDRVRLALADPDRGRQAPYRPLRLPGRRRRAGGLKDAQPLVVAVAARPTRPRPVGQ